MRAWFLPRGRDVLDLLCRQGQVVQAAVTAAAEWSKGHDRADQAVERLRALCTQERSDRRQLLAAVRESFSTPLEPEDLFELAERLGAVADAAYAVVREAELTRTAPDEGLRTMLSAALAPVVTLQEALGQLPRGGAAQAADLAADQLRAVDHAYRQATAALADEPDLRVEIRRRALHRRAEHLSVAVGRVAHRTWYAVAKAG